ncbi:type II toxin-antitoxin system PemK/MazF family toxin [Nocardia vulneris]|uniref:type II toxin-antitoxin system PemK/MazF family toxin n=1 Tax=Nocardia vulneris TaxID=1141657 RepID=UPI000A6D3281|nr:type II toxin-antitoxin system PemK/MazF family toxin [Nocardia vulneris]
MIRGAIHKINLGEVKRGHEQRGRRYGVILSVTNWSMVTVVPTSTGAQDSPWRPAIELMDQRTLLMVDQIRSLDTNYVLESVGFLSAAEQAVLDQAIRRYLRL